MSQDSKLRYLPLADTRLFCRGLFQVRWICTMRWWKPLCHVAVSRCLLADLVWSGIRTPRPSPVHYLFANNFQDHPSVSRRCLASGVISPISALKCHLLEVTVASRRTPLSAIHSQVLGEILPELFWSATTSTTDQGMRRTLSPYTTRSQRRSGTGRSLTR